MYNINYNNLKRGYKVYGIFFVIGMILLLVFCLLIFQGLFKKLSMDSEVKAYDVDVVRTGTRSVRTRATYYYMVNGEKYEYTLIPSNNNPVISRLKTKNTIYYESSDPSNCVAEYETVITGTDVLLIAFILIFPIVGVKGIFSVKERINKVKWLAQNGTLIKGLNYQLVGTSVKVNGKRIMAIQVDYKLPSGSVVKLTGDPRYDLKSYDEDGLVDLLIDVNDINNYYIDFNIN